MAAAASSHSISVHFETRIANQDATSSLNQDARSGFYDPSGKCSFLTVDLGTKTTLVNLDGDQEMSHPFQELAMFIDGVVCYGDDRGHPRYRLYAKHNDMEMRVTNEEELRLADELVKELIADEQAQALQVKKEAAAVEENTSAATSANLQKLDVVVRMCKEQILYELERGNTSHGLDPTAVQKVKYLVDKREGGSGKGQRRRSKDREDNKGQQHEKKRKANDDYDDLDDQQVGKSYKELPKLRIGERVRLLDRSSNRWNLTGHIKQRRNNGRSYTILLEGNSKLYTRLRRYIKPIDEPEEKEEAEVGQKTTQSKKKNGSCRDESTSRKRARDGSTSPPRRRARDGSTSPSRRRARDSSTSPSRRRTRDESTSPPRRRIRDESTSPLSPPRRSRVGDNSVSSRAGGRKSASPSSRKRHRDGSVSHGEKAVSPATAAKNRFPARRESATDQYENAKSKVVSPVEKRTSKEVLTSVGNVAPALVEPPQNKGQAGNDKENERGAKSNQPVLQTRIKVEANDTLNTGIVEKEAGANSKADKQTDKASLNKNIATDKVSNPPPPLQTRIKVEINDSLPKDLVVGSEATGKSPLQEQQANIQAEPRPSLQVKDTDQTLLQEQRSNNPMELRPTISKDQVQQRPALQVKDVNTLVANNQVAEQGPALLKDQVKQRPALQVKDVNTLVANNQVEQRPSLQEQQAKDQVPQRPALQLKDVSKLMDQSNLQQQPTNNQVEQRLQTDVNSSQVNKPQVKETAVTKNTETVQTSLLSEAIKSEIVDANVPLEETNSAVIEKMASAQEGNEKQADQPPPPQKNVADKMDKSAANKAIKCEVQNDSNEASSGQTSGAVEETRTSAVAEETINGSSVEAADDSSTRCT